MQGVHMAALAGVFLASAAAEAFLAIAFFGDKFLKNDEALRKAMDFVMYAMLAALLVVAFVVAYVTNRVCLLTPSVGI